MTYKDLIVARVDRAKDFAKATKSKVKHGRRRKSAALEESDQGNQEADASRPSAEVA